MRRVLHAAALTHEHQSRSHAPAKLINRIAANPVLTFFSMLHHRPQFEAGLSAAEEAQLAEDIAVPVSTQLAAVAQPPHSAQPAPAAGDAPSADCGAASCAALVPMLPAGAASAPPQPAPVQPATAAIGASPSDAIAADCTALAPTQQEPVTLATPQPAASSQPQRQPEPEPEPEPELPADGAAAADGKARVSGFGCSGRHPGGSPTAVLSRADAAAALRRLAGGRAGGTSISSSLTASLGLEAPAESAAPLLLQPLPPPLLLHGPPDPPQPTAVAAYKPSLLDQRLALYGAKPPAARVQLAQRQRKQDAAAVEAQDFAQPQQQPAANTGQPPHNAAALPMSPPPAEAISDDEGAGERGPSAAWTHPAADAGASTPQRPPAVWTQPTADAEAGNPQRPPAGETHSAADAEAASPQRAPASETHPAADADASTPQRPPASDTHPTADPEAGSPQRAPAAESHPAADAEASTPQQAPAAETHSAAGAEAGSPHRAPAAETYPTADVQAASPQPPPLPPQLATPPSAHPVAVVLQQALSASQELSPQAASPLRPWMLDAMSGVGSDYTLFLSFMAIAWQGQCKGGTLVCCLLLQLPLGRAACVVMQQSCRSRDLAAHSFRSGITDSCWNYVHKHFTCAAVS